MRRGHLAQPYGKVRRIVVGPYEHLSNPDAFTAVELKCFENTDI